LANFWLGGLFAISEYLAMALTLTPAATRAFLAMPKKEREQLRARLVAIAAVPTERHPSVTAMQGAPAGRFRVRQGDWRAVFMIDGADVVVIRIGHRSEVYER
jgi:mRNA-degrading endonuclease RelE of RelBE toxin-antitoxin system